MIDLYVVCWQDVSEPWGWAPYLSSEDGMAPGASLPEWWQPFHWRRRDAEVALAQLVDAFAADSVRHIRDRDEERAAKREEAREDWRRRGGVSLPGVRITGVGWEEHPGRHEPEPEPYVLMTDEEVKQAALADARRELSVQQWKVPEPPRRRGIGWGV